MADVDASSYNLKLQRGISGWGARWARVEDRFAVLNTRWWFRTLAWLALLAGVGFVVTYTLLTRDLPSAEALKEYEPPLPTNVRSADGLPIYSYARERRVELSYDEYPQVMIDAILAAEDRNFFDHSGVDYVSIVGAVISNMRSDGRPVGASTITQQVAKNLLLDNEVSYIRKAREAILAFRIEDSLTKQQILELYLNQIALGRNAFGVESAAQAYFGKSVADLALHEAAYLAILPKGPSNYMPERHAARAIERRNWVLGQMLRNEFITQGEHDAAVRMPLGAIPRQTPTQESLGGYFIEDVRRELMERFGETDEAGPNSVYAGGLWVRTSLDPDIQRHTTQALRDGLLRFDRARGWSGPIREAEFEGDGWESALLNTNIALDYEDWRAAIVISKSGDTAAIGFADGTQSTLSRGNAQMPVRGEGGTAFAKLKAGDIIAVAPSSGDYALRSIPRVSGGMVVQDPRTGRVLAMQGGFDASVQAFNRATQAQRQPGSTIKPIVYTAALERGMTPATLINDGTFCVDQGAGLGRKCFQNFNNQRGAGMRTMRWGIEQSRNLMTIQAANTTGMNHVTDLMHEIGASAENFPNYLSYALGAGESTVLRMTNAYSVLVNHGRALNPTLVDFVQNRRGQVIWPENWRACERCNMRDYDGQPMPRPQSRSRQVVDPMSAYQMVHVLEGVIQRGTATTLRDLNRPIMGKTGTSSGPRDVWFIGGSPQMIAGLYLGHDTPTNLGNAQGGTIAAPIFKQFATAAYEGMEVLPFRAPAGTRMVRIDRMSGRPVYGTWPTDEARASVIWEAFKPESEPRRTARTTGSDREEAPKVEAKAVQRQAEAQPRDSDFLQRQGGIY